MVERALHELASGYLENCGELRESDIEWRHVVMGAKLLLKNRVHFGSPLGEAVTLESMLV